MESLGQWLNSVVKDLEHPLFKDVVRVEVEVNPLNDGQLIFISDIKRVHLTLVTSGGDRRHLKAVAKTEAPEGPGRTMAADTGAFRTEILVYSQIIKSMESIMSDVNDNDSIWPECYVAKENNFLLQDLCEVGYRIVPTYRFLDAEHATLVMKGIAKFHALSLVLSQRSCLDLSQFGLPFFARPNQAMEKVQKMTIDGLADVIREWGSEWSSVPERLLNYIGNPLESARKTWEKTCKKWVVLNHGDFTMRNMLFHYPPGSDRSDHVKFVDFQMCHASNLAYDITSLLYSSVFPTVRDANMTSFLTAYTDTFVSTCRRHGYKGPDLTLDDVRDCIGSLHAFCNMTSFFQVPFFLQSGSKDSQKRADTFLENYNADDADGKSFTFVDFKDPKVVEVLQSELKRCMEAKYF